MNKHLAFTHTLESPSTSSHTHSLGGYTRCHVAALMDSSSTVGVGGFQSLETLHVQTVVTILGQASAGATTEGIATQGATHCTVLQKLIICHAGSHSIETSVIIFLNLSHIPSAQEELRNRGRLQ